MIRTRVRLRCGPLRGSASHGNGNRRAVEVSEERKARNEAIFRDANEEIAAAHQRLPSIAGRAPFFCECSDAGCREVVRLRRDEYEAVRANPAGFVLASGHPSDSERVLAQHEDYVVVEKDGVAREIAVDTDPRGEDG